jgi:hypothetical protein
MSIKALGALQLPSQKEWAAGLGGLVAFGIIALSNYLGHPLGDETDSLLVVVLPPLISKLVPPSAADVLTHVNDAVVAAGVIAGKLTPPAQIVAADPSNALMLQPATLVPSPASALAQADLAAITQPTRSGIMADPAVVLNPLPPTPPAQPWGGLIPATLLGAAKAPGPLELDPNPPTPHYDPPTA